MVKVMGYWMNEKFNSKEVSLPYGMVLCYLLIKKGIKLSEFNSTMETTIKVGFGPKNIGNIPLKKKGQFWFWDDF